MKMVETPIIHAAAYVYPDELRIRYFINPVVGTNYVGGYEMLLKRDGFSASQLPEHTQGFPKIWTHIANTLWSLQDSFYEKPVPLDVEFLVDRENGREVFHIVQIRPVSRPHEKNYLQSLALSQTGIKIQGEFLISNSHLYHSVGEVTNGQVIDLRDCRSFPDLKKVLENVIFPVILVSHQGGEGTFELLARLPEHSQVAALLITHPEERQHDHLQYSVYEDRRLNMIIHCSQDTISNISNGDKVMIKSNGNQASITKRR